MSRKHFNSIARGVANVRPPADTPEFLQWRLVVDQLALSCAEANPGFKRERFLDACLTW